MPIKQVLYELLLFHQIKKRNHEAPEYDNEYPGEAATTGDEYFLDAPPPQSMEGIKHVEQRADVRADVPKHAGKLFHIRGVDF